MVIEVGLAQDIKAVSIDFSKFAQWTYEQVILLRKEITELKEKNKQLEVKVYNGNDL